MLNSRKWRFAMMLGGTLAMSAISSFAQTTCNVSFQNKALRKEGTAEGVGDITISGAAGACDIPASGATIVVTLNTPVVNTSTGATPILTQAYVGGVPVPGSTGVVSGGGSVITYGPTTGAGTINNLSLSGIRVNASLLSGSSAVTATQVQVTQGGNIYTLTPTSGNVGTVNANASLAVSAVGGSDATTSAAAAVLATCNNNSNNKVSGFLRLAEDNPAFLRTLTNEGNGAQNGTRISATLTIPAGTTVYLPNQDITTGNNTLHLESGVAAGDVPGTVTKTYTPATGDTMYAGSFGAVTSGTAVVYSVSADSVVTKDTLNIPIIVVYTATATQGPVTASAGLAPATGAPSFTAPSGSLTVVTVGACSTSLLFPYVLSDGGWDTGLAITNTGTTDSGTCTISFYGRNNAGGEVPEPVTSPSVAPGGIFAWSITYGGEGVDPVTPGFQGHAIAQCNFRMAHGYGFLATRGGANSGYLALVLQRPITGDIESLGH